MKIYVQEACDPDCGETYRARELAFNFKRSPEGGVIGAQCECKCDFPTVELHFTYLDEVKNMKDALEQLYKTWEEELKIEK